MGFLSLSRFFQTASRRFSLLTPDTINYRVLNTSYAVRGPVLDRAMELDRRLKAGEKLPFDRLVECNIGNPHALKQTPISYVRKVLTLLLNPALIEYAPAAIDEFPPDIVERAKRYLREVPAIGAYSHSQGIPVVRQEIATSLLERDGYPSDMNNIFLTSGASEGVRIMMNTVLRHEKKDGVLTPIPQYPLYSALTTFLDGTLVPYYLNESDGWSLSVDELANNMRQFQNAGTDVRALVVINPGNPTGQVLPESNMRSIVDFCAKSNLVLFADEVYQENIWKKNTEFVSFKKVACDMGFDGSPNCGLQLVSFHSVSKGFLGECGLRGGYFELFGVDSATRQQIYKLASIYLPPNSVGQIVTGLMVNPPKKGDFSYNTYVQERDEILNSMRSRALLVSQSLNQLEGISCNPSDGAMYLFPQLHLPAKFVAEANSLNTAADLLYCLRLLDHTGIITVPGSGFRQQEGTWHLRTTILPPEDQMENVMSKFKEFHEQFMNTYR